ncbi:hypothetical protein AWC05_25500 [Mycobacterium florentinum]|uniref:Uncharacterized protein n=1 Tax=Mycobacterium florentinum TaxID=292462 RepID=A0A1X1U819_MYCFL|nr:3-keto-5-aminohexanoate cleavage protein [Mycobacterium florentinum]ORV52809.1 hypothetical protein AWC05_25500 [Mycobacterium florentinum]
MLHLRVRADDGAECLRAERYGETIEAVKARVLEMTIEVSTRGAAINRGVDKGGQVRTAMEVHDVPRFGAHGAIERRTRGEGSADRPRIRPADCHAVAGAPSDPRARHPPHRVDAATEFQLVS